MDPDIVLVNIENSDRAILANLISEINSHKPAVLAINVFFGGEKDRYDDSLLIEALRIANNDILPYTIEPDDGSLTDGSHAKFGKFATAVCQSRYERKNELVSHMIPLQALNGAVHELFPLKIVKLWKPGFRHDLKEDQIIAINYKRSLESFQWVNGSDILSGDSSITLKNKVVILGYIGPTDEDKFFTPVRLVKQHNEEEPDTYGSVILANAIRTILKHEVKE